MHMSMHLSAALQCILKWNTITSVLIYQKPLETTMGQCKQLMAKEVDRLMEAQLRVWNM